MSIQQNYGTVLWTIPVFFGAAVFVVAALLLVSHFVGQRHTERDTGKQYEGGAESTGDARIRYDFRFYLVAILFIIFDIETAFIFAWAIAIRELGWSGYIEILIVIAILTAVLVYILRLGVLQMRRVNSARNQNPGATKKNGH
jgi:NADH-quinone oxidoreductase subunit A